MIQPDSERIYEQEVQKLTTENAELRTKLEKAQAKCSAKDVILREVYEWCISDNPSDIDGDEVKAALETDGAISIEDQIKAQMKEEEHVRYTATIMGWRSPEDYAALEAKVKVLRELLLTESL